MRKTIVSLFVLVLMLLLPCGILADTGDSGQKIWVLKFKQDISISSAVSIADTEDNDEIEPLGQKDSRYFTTTDPEVAADFADSGLCEYVEEGDTCYTSVVPNDAKYEAPYDLLVNKEIITIQGQYALKMLHAEEAWDTTMGSSNVNVVVIDSGFDYAHEDGKNINAGFDYITEAPNSGDNANHGTACAGIIGATTNNGIGIAGAAPDCNVTMLRCFVLERGASRPTANTAHIAAAIRDAVNIYHADVINMSFGASKNNTALKEAIDYAYSKGVILIAATGNNQAGGSPLEYPAAYGNVVGVGAVDPSEALAYYSTANKSTFVVAPGSHILTLNDKGKYYGGYEGTSFATPYVSALAGLARSLDPDISASEFSAMLKATSRDLGTAGYDYNYGYGLIDYSAFLNKMEKRSFVDVPEDQWYTASVYDLKDNDVISGCTTYTFCPALKVTRAAFVTMLARMSKDDLNGYRDRGQFKDVASDTWCNPYVNWAADKKIVYGKTETLFSPNDMMTREEMCAMLCRYMESENIPFNNETEISFSDIDTVSFWAKENVDTLIQSGLIAGCDDNTFRPQACTSRAEAAALVDRIFKLSETV